MGDNNIQLIGNRLRLIDPNNFDNQYAGGVFSDTRYNMSVPLEDLSIIVELKTSKKARTILTTQGNTSSIINQDKSGNINVTFIKGSEDDSTANQDYLTTKYTEVSTTLTAIEEALGISSIDIDFSSSYAPMVTINFIDVRGGAIFQPNGDSPFNVFFRLPYPLFELKIKGYYGKPVTYCLHMLKCNTKFNSQTGNFELTANFIGYTYAMLSDMIVGYLKAAGETPRGKELLAQRRVPSINTFLKDIANIDKLIKDNLLVSSDEDVSNLSKIKDLREIIEKIRTLISTTIGELKNSQVYKEIDTLAELIAIIQDPSPDSQYFLDTENTKIINTFLTNVNTLKDEFNTKANGIQDIAYGTGSALAITTTTVGRLYNKDVADRKDKLYTDVSDGYGLSINNKALLDAAISRLKSASANVPSEDQNDNKYIKYYDFTDVMTKDVDERLTVLSERETDLSKSIALKLKDLITKKLGFDTSIRNIINIFTTHIEIFLQQMFEVSSKYNTDQLRLTELKPFIKNTDIRVENSNQIIYPWPEYHENNVEKYLGSKKGPLKIPLNVPEIKFVEDIFQGMITSEAVIEDVNRTLSQGTPTWLAFSPLDSLYYNKSEKNPYERLGDNPQPIDIVRLVTLRATGFLGFSNSFDSLSDDEIKNFATQEGSLVLDKYKNGDNKILKIIKENFSTADQFATVTGTINGISKKVLASDIGDTKWKYDYIDYGGYSQSLADTGKRALLPIEGPFADASGSIYSLKNLEDISIDEFKLSNLNSSSISSKDSLIFGNPDTANYLDIITGSDYDNTNIKPPTGQNTPTFNLEGLKIKITSVDQLKSAGFLANSGTYGVQEFTTINNNNRTSKYFSLFYDNGNINFANENTFVSSIARVRGYNREGNKPYTTIWDLPTDKNTGFAVALTTPTGNAGYNDETTTINGLQKIFRPRDSKSNKNPNAREDVGDNLLLLHDQTNNNQSSISIPFVNFSIENSNGPITEVQLSLFGSRFYNSQTLLGRTFLFLHTMPWKGLIFNSKEGFVGMFRQYEILNSFELRTGFVQVPKLFPAFIGGLLWRLQQTTDPIKWNVGGNILIPTFVTGDYIPKQDEYLKSVGDNWAASPMYFDAKSETYAKLEIVIKNLPKSVRDKFINEFLDFANNEFNTLRKDFELSPINQPSLFLDESWRNSYNNIVTGSTNGTDAMVIDNGIPKVKVKSIENNLKMLNGQSISQTFNVFSFVTEVDGNNVAFDPRYRYNYILEYIDGSPAVINLKKLFFEYKYIANHSWLIWNEDFYNSPDTHTPILMGKDRFKLYIDSFNTKIKDFVDTDQKKRFGTNDLEEIKFEIYRTLKKIYDKWVAYTDNPDKILFQCCTVNPTGQKADRLSGDTQLNIHRGGDGKNLTLIDSFRFVTRSFRDIGDEFQINPLIISNILLESTNVSFYDLISRILTDNNFDFIALPSFVDYNDDKELASVFQPIPYYEASKITTVGPSFVCVYVGQTSSKLDFGTKSDYPNDGFDLTNDSTSLPTDFKGVKKAWEDIGAAFVVRYGQQNQNIFKDIHLDQSEVGETAESLQITDNIANRLSDTNQSYVGQNLYNVYSVRSYKVEVEMLGDAMIQPMMYFQLENIPMFHGAYLITRVKHSLKPNHMTTVFNGTRIKINETPLIDAAALYSGILQGYQLPTASATSTLTNNVGNYNNYVYAYYDILSNNIPANKTIEGSQVQGNNILTTAEAELAKWQNGTVDQADGEQFIIAYFNRPNPNGYNIGLYTHQAWSSAFISYVMRSGDPIFPATQTHYDYITAAMNGNFGYEVFPLKLGFRIKAEVGDILTFGSPSRGYTASHSNLIYKIDGNVAHLIGGNRQLINGGDERTVRESTIQLDGGFITDATDVGTYKLLTKKTNNVYYGSKKLANQPTNLTSVSVTDQIKIALKFFIETKKMEPFKAIAIIGCIRGESASLNPKEQNSIGAYGIAQWLGPKKLELQRIPNFDTFSTQLNFLYSDTRTDSTSKDFLANSTNQNEALAAMFTYERPEYVAAKPNGLFYQFQPTYKTGSATYTAVYKTLLQNITDAQNGKTVNGDVQRRVNYMLGVQKIYESIKNTLHP